MAFFNLVFLAVVFLIGLVLWILVWTILLALVGYSWRRKRLVLAWPLGGPTYVVFVALWLMHQWSPTTVFENEFGFPPPPDVVRLQTSTFQLGDSGDTSIEFDTDIADGTIHRAKALDDL